MVQFAASNFLRRLSKMLKKEQVKKLLFYKGISKKCCMEMYPVHYYATRYLLDRFGKKKFLLLIEKYTKKMNKASFERKFKNIYRISYKQFIKDVLEKSDMKKIII